ncbi:DUF1345 domain-containing protein [Sphingobium subterraneum]|uniref:Putative membrane protein n=1 Tax=Sphingobium subterraneum TaxID=627688 RepID=A0A841IYX0_9SPHN|nr:DUF1345 domain-containing protein [Sphingobium subterraneum]MBB6124149.1 putative membrane protein [Sphingobium subterraneum]
MVDTSPAQQPVPLERGAKSPFLPWRYGLFLALCLSAVPIALALPWSRAVMGGFDIAAMVFIATLWPLFGHDHKQIRDAARRNNANREVMLLVTFIVSFVLLVAVGVELSQKQNHSAWTITLVIATLMLAWLFSNFIYAMHYAYLWYSPDTEGDDCGGVDFPGDGPPEFWDFTYFSFTLGMTFQTSDMDITSRSIRKVVTAHCLAAFVFNLGIVAFTINVLGG